MKENKKKEYHKKTSKLFEAKIYCRNLIRGINTLGVSLVRYSGPFLTWTRELRQMDPRTRKLMTIHKALDPRDDTERLNVLMRRRNRTYQYSRSVDASLQRLKDYIHTRGGRLITASRKNADSTSINKTEITRKQKWEVKQLGGHFKRQNKRNLTQEHLDMIKKRKP